MAEQVQLTYLGPAGRYRDPTTGLDWLRGSTVAVDKDVADRLQQGTGVWDAAPVRPALTLTAEVGEPTAASAAANA